MNGKAENLKSQVDKIFHGDNQKSIKTRYRYRDAEYRFCTWIGENSNVKKLKNIKAKHIYIYVEFLKAQGYSSGYIYVELSGIRYFHSKTGSNEILPENKRLNLEHRIHGGVNRSWNDNEVSEAIKLAENMKRYDVSKAIMITNTFGLRLEEAISLTVKQVKDAVNSKELYIINTKGKHPRTVPVENINQELALLYLLQNKATDERVFISRGKYTHEIKKSIQDWIRNHRSRFQDEDRVSNRDAKSIIKRLKQQKIKGTIPKTALSMHGNRHSYASKEFRINRDKGFSEDEARLQVSELLGHHRTDVTKIYTNDN